MYLRKAIIKINYILRNVSHFVGSNVIVPIIDHFIQIRKSDKIDTQSLTSTLLE